jgi:hypothetical protein
VVERARDDRVLLALLVGGADIDEQGAVLHRRVRLLGRQARDQAAGLLEQ